MNRRHLLAAAAAAPLVALSTRAPARQASLALSEAEWRKRLTPAQFRILRQDGTERPYSSPLNKEKRVGVYVCAGCALPLFLSSTKFESGTGWPSFYDVRAGAVTLKSDTMLGMVRTEVECRRCGGHLGHVFDDGPRPTGKRYCMNGDAMRFTPAA